MAYTTVNFKTKKALKDALEQGKRIGAYQPGGMFPDPDPNGKVTLEGPHYPEPHRWYATAQLKDGAIVPGSVK